MLWVFRLQLSPCAAVPGGSPALAAVLGMDVVSLLLSSATNGIVSGLVTPLERKSGADRCLGAGKMHRFPVAKHDVKKERRNL